MKYIKRFFSSIFFVSIKMFFTGYKKVDTTDLITFEGDKVRVYQKGQSVKIYLFKKDNVICHEREGVVEIISDSCLALKRRLSCNGDERLRIYNFKDGITSKLLPYEVFGSDSKLTRVEVFDKEGYLCDFGDIRYVVQTNDEPFIFFDKFFNIVLNDVLSYTFVKKSPTTNYYLLVYLGCDRKFYIVDDSMKKSSGYEMIIFGNEKERNFDLYEDENFTRLYTLPLIAIYKDDMDGTVYNLITMAKVLDTYEEYEKIYPSKDGIYMLARDKNGKYGYLTMNGFKKTTFDYSFLSPVTHGRCFARRGTSSFVLYDVEHDKEYGRVYKRIYHDFKDVLYGCVKMELALVETYSGIFYVDIEDNKYEIVTKDVLELDECYLTLWKTKLAK